MHVSDIADRGVRPAPACPGCGGADSRPALQPGGVYSLLRCRACGLLYTWPAALPDESVLYPPGYYAHRPATYRAGRLAVVRDLALYRHSGYPVPSAAARLPWLAEVAGILLTPFKRAWRTIPPFVPGGRLLDVGCGSGVYLARLRALGWSVSGVEPDAEACRHARSVLGLDVHCGTLDDAPWPPASFDVVTLWHTFEHTMRPARTLAAAQALLKPGGLLMMEMPNWSSAQRRIFGTNWFHLDLPRHRLHLTPACLGQYLAEAGFVDIVVGTVTSTVGVTGSFETALRRRPWRPGGRPWRHNRLLKTLVWPLDALCSALGAGGCLAATARKP